MTRIGFFTGIGFVLGTIAAILFTFGALVGALSGAVLGALTGFVLDRKSRAGGSDQPQA